MMNVTGERSLEKALLAVFVAVMVLILILVLVKFVALKKEKSERKLPTPMPLKDSNTWTGLYRFSKAEIEKAININNRRKSLGQGSAGEVYEGRLPSGQVVAIKEIKKGNSLDTFAREVAGLSRIRHPNLVSMLGCCIEGDEQYLVLEYCHEGNLAQHLLRNDCVLTWDRRVKILRDCALGLRYLHSYIDGCIVHRDIKLTNILLTENLDPKLSDFGLAKMLGMEESKVFTDVRGTIGYMDPEYMTNAKLTSASDIYSFGIVALQLLSGQKVIELDLDASEQLTRKVRILILITVVRSLQSGI
ncbi:probable leucine-rich repeat receptor-like protein kinase At5g49770 [Hibiscus syriacus]|uniref:probable leucine-rich repeat receptor-like protein kinase At5g49770 n=1 Tax=Hibiscus syriacus TaxID=106335 RepID=UPI001923F58C|nr:probable leucine-rich repeat receptor-like protein kinase At5g49770 [Hibiscus syriacus]